MTISRKTYLFVAALFVFMLAGVATEVEAQDGGGLTCGWCVMDFRDAVLVDYWGNVIDEWTEYRHKFPGGGNECGWDGHDEPGATCSRCGGSTVCHEGFRPGMCHIPCGPAGDDYAVAAEVEEALERGDVAAVALALHAPQEGFTLEFIPVAGRIEVAFSCGPSGAVQSIPVPPAARDRLQAAVAAVAPSQRYRPPA